MEKVTIQINGEVREVSFGMFAYNQLVKVIQDHIETFEETVIDPVTLSGFIMYAGLIGASKVNREKPGYDLVTVNTWLDQNLISQEDFDKINTAYTGSITDQKLRETLKVIADQYQKSAGQPESDKGAK